MTHGGTLMFNAPGKFPLRPGESQSGRKISSRQKSLLLN
jgi:hypothetical protein